MREFTINCKKALEEVQQYRQIGTVEECLKNKDFLDFLSDKMNPNDFETYFRLYNALEEKGCEEWAKNLSRARFAEEKQLSKQLIEITVSLSGANAQNVMQEQKDIVLILITKMQPLIILKTAKIEH